MKSPFAVITSFHCAMRTQVFFIQYSVTCFFFFRNFKKASHARFFRLSLNELSLLCTQAISHHFP